MGKVWVWIVGVTLLSVFLSCGVVDAQQLPVQQGVTSNTKTNCQTGQNRGASETGRNCSEERADELVPKPERNRLEEGRRKRATGGRKRKRSRKRPGANNYKGKHKVGSSLGEEGKYQSDRNSGNQKVSNVKTERVDDIPLLIGSMVKLGLQKVLDNHIPVHWKQRELSWGWTAVIWLAYILSEGDHRKVVVREYVSGMKRTLRELTGAEIDELDFTDDRLAILLRYLSNEEYWEKIEQELSENTIEVYELPKALVRCDATTVSGYHEAVEGGMFQFGHTKDDPNLPQIKIMTGSLDPLGMPLATDVVSGEKADDRLYAPVISRINSVLKKAGVVYVGDCKLSSFENRLHIKGVKGYYLCPLPHTGETAEKMEGWIEEGILRDERDELIKFIVTDEKGKEELKAKGYEIKRRQSGVINKKEIKWTERVLIVNSPSYAKQREKGLERRIKNAEEKIYALTPERGRGKRQITDEPELIAAVEAVLKKHRVEDFLNYEYVKEIETQTKYVGRGKGGPNREKKVIEKIRYVITKVTRHEEKIKGEIKKYGWKVYVTDVSKGRFSFIDVVKCYRKEYRVERVFNRLKSRLNISPLFLKRDDHATGLTHLLTLGVRVLTLIQYIVRRSLQKSNEKLVGLHLENPKKPTDIPTSERLLKAFSKVTLTIIETGDSLLRHLTPLSELQVNILGRLGLDTTIYTNLAIQQSTNLLSEQ